MDASPHTLAENVRARRVAIDNDLALLRSRLENANPRQIDPAAWTNRVLPVAAAAAAVWFWRRRRRRVGSLRQLLVHCLADLYRGEYEALPALDRMLAQSHDEELKQAFAQHRYETEGHVERLERVFCSVGAKPPPRRRSSPAVAAIVVEGERLLARKGNRHVRDAWLIATAQRVEHLEMADYGTARTYAEMLGYTFAAQLLEQTLEEERGADKRLTMLAERFVNPESLRSPTSR